MDNIVVLSALSQKGLDVYARLTEAQLRSRQNAANGVFIAESVKVIEHALDAGCMPVSFLMERKHITGKARGVLARCPGVPVYTGEEDMLAELTGFRLSRGVLCAMRRPRLLAAEEACANARRIAVLEDIIDPTNVGAIFRSAAALNMDAVLLTPSCCDPLHRRAVRVSMGTVFQLPWSYASGDASQWREEGAKSVKEMGFTTVALALDERALRIDDSVFQTKEKLAVVLGTEGDGLSPRTIASCDYTARIPMARGVDSLNVAAAGAVAFWQLGNRNE